MKKNLLYGIIGGAAVGAAASYLMGAKERKNLVSGIRSLGESVGSMTGLMGSEESGSSSSSSRSTSSNSGSGKSKSGGSKSGGSSTSRRG